MTRGELEMKTVDELRTLARSMGRGGAAILALSKASLINHIMGAGDNPGLPIPAGAGAAGAVDLADVLASALQGRIKGGMDESRVSELIQAAFEPLKNEIDKQIKEAVAGAPREVIVKVDNQAPKNLGLQHKIFGKVLTLARLRLNVFLVGPSGSGKTHLAGSVAKALDLPCYVQPVGLQTSKSDLMGYLNASGGYTRSMLREAYEKGGVFLLDEIDAGNPNVLTVINGLAANGEAGFPDSMVTRHKDFVFLAAGNTFGRGADRVFVGRLQLDGATLNRFATLYMDYDEDLEMGLSFNKTWCGRVQKIRAAVDALKEKIIVSPRASIAGGVMLANGFNQSEVEDCLIWQGCNPEIKRRVLEGVR